MEAAGILPLEPRSGSADGGTFLRWIGEEPTPAEVFVGNRPCAALRGGIFVTPMCQVYDGADEMLALDVILESESGSRSLYKNAFAYWTPGAIISVAPDRGPVTGDLEAKIETTDLGAPISEVRINGAVCALVGVPTPREALVLLPAAQAEGEVAIEVVASNGNSAALKNGLSYYTPEFFGSAGENVTLSQDRLTASRTEGVNRAVCLGGFPLRRVSGGRYFEVLIEEVCKSTRALAVGVCVLPSLGNQPQGRVRAKEARELGRAWLAGYDKGGALYISDGKESKIPPALWRPVRSVAAGTRIGVLWCDAKADVTPGGAATGAAAFGAVAGGEAGAADLVIFQDGVERARLPAVGRLPSGEEELFAVVDLQGTAKRLRLLPGSSPPVPSPLLSGNAEGDAPAEGPST